MATLQRDRIWYDQDHMPFRNGDSLVVGLEATRRPKYSNKKAIHGWRHRVNQHHSTAPPPPPRKHARRTDDITEYSRRQEVVVEEDGECAAKVEEEEERSDSSGKVRKE